MTEPFVLLGDPASSDILIVADHASNHVPPDIDLKIDPGLLQSHIAWDIGIAAIAQNLSSQAGYAAFLGSVSRLVVDLNRYADEEDVITLSSDGTNIAGNRMNDAERKQRLHRYYHPYHSKLAEIISTSPPKLILSLHSFAPILRSRPDIQRPWEIGVLYNSYETASRLALDYLGLQPVIAGDQLPYSGKDLNATMNQHAEAAGIPYTGVEIRQDLLGDAEGINVWSKRLAEMLSYILGRLPQSI